MTNDSPRIVVVAARINEIQHEKAKIQDQLDEHRSLACALEDNLQAANGELEKLQRELASLAR